MTKELKVLSKSKELVEFIYSISRQLPKIEQYILIPQILRSAISIPSNIAEGQQRSDKEFIRFIRFARGSLAELKIQLDIITNQYGLSFPETYKLIEEVQKMTYGLMLRLYAEGS